MMTMCRHQQTEHEHVLKSIECILRLLLSDEVDERKAAMSAVEFTRQSHSFDLRSQAKRRHHGHEKQAIRSAAMKIITPESMT